MVVPNYCIDTAADSDCLNKKLATTIVTSSWTIYNFKFDLRFLMSFHGVRAGSRDNSHLHTTFRPRPSFTFLRLHCSKFRDSLNLTHHEMFTDFICKNRNLFNCYVIKI